MPFTVRMLSLVILLRYYSNTIPPLRPPSVSKPIVGLRRLLTDDFVSAGGHLSTTFNRLKELDKPIGPKTPTTAAVRYPRTFHLREMKVDDAGDEHDEGDLDEIASNTPPIMQLREDLAKELTSPQGAITYPHNLTVANFCDYLICPTLCYELEYPRNASRSYLELFYKTLAVFGCIFLMTVASEEFIIPVLDESRIRLQQTPTWIDSSLIFAETISRLLFPFMIIFLLVFLSWVQPFLCLR